MKAQYITLATMIALAAPAVAQSADANEDGMLSVEEVQAAWPEVTTDDFMAWDADGDGLLSETEVAAAQEAGALTEES